MLKHLLIILTLCVSVLAGCSQSNARKTIVIIKGNQFFINGEVTYPGRYWNGHKIEGLLFNSRMVQGIFDDLNPDTKDLWIYPDTKTWDPQRNTDEFIAAMPEWKNHGMLAFTINLQGGSPQGYSKVQPWHNSAVTEEGELREDFMARLEKIIDNADELGMAVILGIFYFGQDERLNDEKAIINAVENTVEWLLNKGYTNVLIELVNECDNNKYDHEILKPSRVHELIKTAKNKYSGNYRLLVSTSYNGGSIPDSNVVEVSDYIILHGNSVRDPRRITEMINETRNVQGYKDQPIVFNEDDHYDFDKPENNLLSAIDGYASWGYFDFRRMGEDYEEGFQSVPVDWRISTDRKRAFFNKIKEITGY